MLRHTLYYPFHLCHERTLRRLLEDYATVHFRDSMAQQVTSMSELPAYENRMGDQFPDLVRSGRIVQGCRSGPPDEETNISIDRDLADPAWRSLFHEGLKEDRRFQRGLFDCSHGMRIGSMLVPGPAALLCLMDESRLHQPFTVQDLKTLSWRRLSGEDGYRYEYGMALVKTAASLVCTVRFCLQHRLEAVTDSPVHFRLLDRTRGREQLPLTHHLIPREES